MAKLFAFCLGLLAWSSALADQMIQDSYVDPQQYAFFGHVHPQEGCHVTPNDPDADCIPGTAGIDYPVFSEVPDNSFDCSAQKWPGLYADPAFKCQVFHICNLERVKSSFVCPRGTILDQRYFVCVWWFNFNCDDATSFYYLNKDFYNASSSPAAVPIVADSPVVPIYEPVKVHPVQTSYEAPQPIEIPVEPKPEPVSTPDLYPPPLAQHLPSPVYEPQTPKTPEYTPSPISEPVAVPNVTATPPQPMPNPGYEPQPMPKPEYEPKPMPNPGYEPKPMPNPGYEPKPIPNPAYVPQHIPNIRQTPEYYPRPVYPPQYYQNHHHPGANHKAYVGPPPPTKPKRISAPAPVYSRQPMYPPVYPPPVPVTHRPYVPPPVATPPAYFY